MASEAMAQEMNKDAALPAKLPEWKQTVDPVPKPVRPRRDRCDVTDSTTMNIEYGVIGRGVLVIVLSRLDSAWPTEGDDAQQRLATLEFVAAEMEQAIPVVRKMIEQMKEGT